jgi:hypothetical protein
MADATTKFQEGIEGTCNQSLINQYNQTGKTFDNMQQLIEDSGLGKPEKRKLKKLARNAYS